MLMVLIWVTIYQFALVYSYLIEICDSIYLCEK